MTGEPFSPTVDLKALLDFLGIQQVDLCGLSRGGALALDFALDYPESTRAVIAAASALRGHQRSPEWEESFGAVVARARGAGVPAAIDLWLEDPLFASVRERPAAGQRLEAMLRDYSGWHFLNASGERSSEPPTAARLAAIAAPTLVISGERDVPDHLAIADRLAREIPNARTLSLSGVGHLVNMEVPAAFNAAVQRFLDELDVER